MCVCVFVLGEFNGYGMFKRGQLWFLLGYPRNVSLSENLLLRRVSILSLLRRKMFFFLSLLLSSEETKVRRNRWKGCEGEEEEVLLFVIYLFFSLCF